MIIVIFTSLPIQGKNAIVIHELSNHFAGLKVVAIDRSNGKYRKNRIQKLWRQLKKQGILKFTKKLIDRPSLNKCRQEWKIEMNDEFRLLFPYEYSTVLPDYVVDSVNGKNTERTIQEIHPDLLIQLGAGILKPNIFNIPKYFTLNMHHGIAPKIKGGDSIFWANYFGKKEWLGITIHKIDVGIDTGEVLIRKWYEGHWGLHPARIFARLTRDGLTEMIALLNSMQSGVIPIPIDTSCEKSTYKSFFNSSQYNSLKKNNWNPISFQ